MERSVERKSKMVSEIMTFKWTISDFSFENLLGGAIKSPSFKCFSTDFHLEVSRNSEKIRLRLVQSRSDDPPLISKCNIGFCVSVPPPWWYGKTFNAPVKDTDVFWDCDFALLMKECLADNVLTAKCVVTASMLKHILHTESAPPLKGEKEILEKKGHAALVKNIGSILEDSRFHDVTLKVGEETFQAHKAILASRSEVFAGMFQSGMKESQESVVEISEMKPIIVKKMLQYIYTATIGDLSMDEAIDLYVGSDRYDLQELKGWCKEFILEHIAPDDVCRVAVIADLHSDEGLAEASRRVFKEDPKKIVGSELWKDFRKENSLFTD